MKYIYTCRRTFLSVVSILCLTFLGYYAKAEVAGALATIVIGVAGANSFQKVGESKFTQEK